jgi:hypothetical protein
MTGKKSLRGHTTFVPVAISSLILWGKFEGGLFTPSIIGNFCSEVWKASVLTGVFISSFEVLGI